MIEPSVWSSQMTTISSWPGLSHSEVKMKSLILPELNFELERVVCQRVIDGEHAKNGSDYSSLITLPEIGVVGDAYHSPLATIEWWQTCRNSGLFQNGTSSPITQSVLCEAVWETQVVHVNHISPNGPSAVGTESSGCCDSQRDDHPPFTFTSDPTVINGLQGDTPCRVGVQPLWFQSQEQARYDSGGGNSWSFEGWHSDVKAISLTGDGSSPYPPSDPDNISSHFEYIDSYRQEVPTHPTTAPENLCLPNTTGFVKYSSSPISAGWASYSVDEDHQRCGNNDAGTSELRRHAKDDFLVRSKRSGMSYREIRNKGHFKEAESTLRGRYRTLTKRREQRVRKPQWQPKDVGFSPWNSLSSSTASDRQIRSNFSIALWLRLVRSATLFGSDRYHLVLTILI